VPFERAGGDGLPPSPAPNPLEAPNVRPATSRWHAVRSARPAPPRPALSWDSSNSSSSS
jgi:hypothetical protein